MDHAWVNEFPGSITVCDLEGIILELNDRAAKNYADRGGRQLIGSNLLDCHSDESRAKVKRLLETRQANIYTIEKKGIKKLIYQSPWFRDGQCGGFVELSLEIPEQMPHFVRQ